jgi:uncharacterized membrane protein YkoI
MAFSSFILPARIAMFSHFCGSHGESAVQAGFTRRAYHPLMVAMERLGIAAALALVMACALACAQDAAPPAQPAANQASQQNSQVCLDQKQRRAQMENGQLIRLSAAMHAAKARMPGTVVRARLCQGDDGLVYVLTVLAHNGKVARIAVDAVKGTVIGGL